jgi:hypothetical protein
MRELNEVIEQILAEVPSDQEALVARLKSVHSSAMTAAPEMMPMWWRETAQLLSENLPMLEKEWQNKVYEIWMKGIPNQVARP